MFLLYVKVWSSDQAEEIKELKQVRPMDEDQLGRFEEDVRSLVNLMQSSRPKVRAQTFLFILYGRNPEWTTVFAMAL